MLNMKSIDRKVVATVAVFLLLAVVYFVPKPVLRMALPEIMVKYRIVGPLLTLSLAGIFSRAEADDFGNDFLVLR